MSEKTSKILRKQLVNSRYAGPTTIAGMTLVNANGDIDPNSAGYQYVIDTLSYIRQNVIEQKFYQIAVADYFPVDVGEAAWSDEIVQNKSYQIAGDFFDGDISTLTGNGRLAGVDAIVDPIRMPVITWAKAAQWTIVEVNRAAQAGNWDVVEERMKTLVKNWQLGIQEVGFLGHPSISAVTGLLNDSEVNINTTLIPVAIKSMSETQLNALIAGLLSAYNTNSNGTAYPDTFVIPTSDYLGLATPYSSTFPNRSRLEYLIASLKEMTKNPNFQILPLTYSDAAYNASRGINKNRYVLYNQSDETMSMSIPVDLNILEAGTANNIYWESPGVGQYSGLLINRKREVLYLDETAA